MATYVAYAGSGKTATYTRAYAAQVIPAGASGAARPTVGLLHPRPRR